MQKNLKKVLSFVLAMVMALGIVTPAVPVFATETAGSSDLPGGRLLPQKKSPRSALKPVDGQPVTCFFLPPIIQGWNLMSMF